MKTVKQDKSLQTDLTFHETLMFLVMQEKEVGMLEKELSKLSNKQIIRANRMSRKPINHRRETIEKLKILADLYWCIIP